MQTYDTTEIGVRQNKGAPRIWLENMRMAKAGFGPGARYDITVGDCRVVLTVKADGTRVVSGHAKGEKTFPVIDINSAKTLGVFDGLDRLRVIFRDGEIHLLPLATQKKAKERVERLAAELESGRPLRIASVCHGGGVLSKALHDGLEEAGVPATLVMANDYERDVLYHASEVNPVWNDKTIAVAAPLQEIVTDSYLLKQVGHVTILEGGLPCTGASLSGRAKKHLSMAEADENVGHLVVAFLALIDALQPAVVLLENVPPYALTASACQIRHMLRDWGYNVRETILEAREFGCLEDRKRLCLIATTAGVEFDFESVIKHSGDMQVLGDILEPVALDDPMWKTVDYLHRKEESDIAAGKGFRMQLLGPESDRVGTIGAAYQKARSTEPRVQHPTDAKLSRLLTPGEHAAAKGTDPRLVAGLPATRAHHLLGNSICTPPFRAVGAALGRTLRNWVVQRTQKREEAALPPPLALQAA